MFHSYKNCKILLDNNEYLCSDISLALQASTEPIYLVGDRHSFSYSPVNGIGGSFRLSYYLTGLDPLKDSLTDETNVISGNIGGLYFSSGYLKGYSLKLQPNNPVKVDADITFFDALSGVFAPTYDLVSETQLLNHANTSFVTDTANTIGDFTNATDINLSFNSDLQPIYAVGDYLPERVVFGKKELTLEVTSDAISGNLSFLGETAAATVTLKD